MKNAKTAVTIGIFAPNQESLELLRAQINTVGLATLTVEAAGFKNNATGRFIESQPDLILVDMQEAGLAIQALQILHTALPESWLLVTSEIKDPQIIIETMRVGAREFLPKPTSTSSLSQALARYIAETQRYQETKNIGKVFCVTSAKGGAGATCVCINLAASLAALPEHRVALIDLNRPVGDAAAYLNLSPQFTIADALSAAPRLDELLLESYMCRTDGLAVLPGPKEFRTGQQFNMDALMRVFDVVARSHTHAIVDVPGSMDKDHLHLITDLSEAVLVVLTPELPSLWRTDRLLRFLSSWGATERLRLVVNRSRKLDEITDSEIEKALNHPVYWKLPNDYPASIQAVNSGKPLVSITGSALAQSYRHLAHTLIGIPLPQKRRGIFTNWRS